MTTTDPNPIARDVVHQVPNLPSGYAGTYWWSGTNEPEIDQHPWFIGQRWEYAFTTPHGKTVTGSARSARRCIDDVTLMCTEGAKYDGVRRE